MTNQAPPTTRGGRYALRPWGSDLAIDVSGRDVAACLDAVVAGLAASVATLPPGLRRRARSLDLGVREPTAMLVAVVDAAIGMLDVDGELAVAIHDLHVDLRNSVLCEVTFAVVELSAVAVHGLAPKAATWHDARLAPTGDGWAGTVVVDL